ncbi:hypothetical protein A7K73_00535 [Candidatus Methylacidiphilum fumarolicum]|nr:hypothetical protein A7K73_00535 [Candidatus Methylacidiphilum fumarolicum]
MVYKDMKNSQRIGIIVGTYNSEKDIKPLLSSFQQLTFMHQIEKIVFVDSASTDKTVDLLEEYLKDTQNIHIIKILRLNTNKGYSYCLNQGIYAFGHNIPDYVLFSNADVIYPPYYLDDLFEELKDYQSYNIGIVGPSVLEPIDKENLQEHRPRNLWGLPQYRDKDQKVYFVNYVHGCSFLVKKEVLEKIGYFDEDYFLFWDEIDFCTRARKAGFSIAIVNRLSILHHPNVVIWDNLNKSKTLLYYQYRNQFLFARKIYGPIIGTLFIIIRFFVFVREFINYIIKKQWNHAKVMILGFLRGLLNEKGISKLPF